jgi:hypothetical protein
MGFTEKPYNLLIVYDKLKHCPESAGLGVGETSDEHMNTKTKIL